jgi:NADH-quinone oxidoreductase subunit N
MTAEQIRALMPLIILAAAATVAMLALAVRRNHAFTLAVTVIGLIAAMLPTGRYAGGGIEVTPLLVIDGFGVFFTNLILAASLAVALLAHGYWAKRPAVKNEEFYILLLLATAGSVTLTAAIHFASFFLALEILSASLYAMIAYERDRVRGVEAGIKYLVLGGASSALLLFGMALAYARTGTLHMPTVAARLSAAGADMLTLAAVALILVGIGFKLALVPFHLWAADVYEGAPAPTAAYAATVSKGAVFVLLVRLASAMNLQADPQLQATLGAAAVVTMLTGNLLALRQMNLKRLLAYSSIAHMGYLLVAFLAAGPLALEAVAFYLAAYFITTLGAFAVLIALSDGYREADHLDDYKGLWRRRPVLAAVFSIMLLSLAGMPLTAGFIGKFYLLAAGVHSRLWIPVGALVLGSTISLFYYLRFVAAAYAPATAMAAAPIPEWPAPASPPARLLPLLTGVTLAVLVILLVYLGVYPASMIGLIGGMLSSR